MRIGGLKVFSCEFRRPWYIPETLRKVAEPAFFHWEPNSQMPAAACVIVSHELKMT
jgi:hypothetical protein